MLWPTTAEQSGKRYGGIAKAADGFVAKWHRAEVGKSWLRHANPNSRRPRRRSGGVGAGCGAAVVIPLSVKVEGNWQTV